jgi:hypothetical protein
MPQKNFRRWVPTYAMHHIRHDGEDALIVRLGHDDRDAPNRKAFRNATPKSVDDSRVVQAFTALARPDVTLEHVAAFITKYGALGGLFDQLPPEVALRFGQRKVALTDAEGTLFRGFGAPLMHFGGEWSLTTAALYQRIAKFVRAIIVLNHGLRSHGRIPWTQYSLKREIQDARAILEKTGFRGADAATLSAFEHASAPLPLEEPRDDDTAIYFAKYAGDEVEQLLRPLVLTRDLQFERAADLDERGRTILAKVEEWRAYWAAVETARRRPTANAATIARFQRNVDSATLESAATFLFTTASPGAQLQGSVGTFRIRFAPTSALQSLALEVAKTLVREGSEPFSTCRLCGLAYQSRVGSKGGRPRSLCDDCFSPRLAKTVSERRRRSTA